MKTRQIKTRIQRVLVTQAASIFRLLLKTVAMLSLAAGVLHSASCSNILFISMDDESPFDLKMCNPRNILQIPTLDRLASEGMVFDGAYHMEAFVKAVCTLSRHMIMSGRTLWHLSISPFANQFCPPYLKTNTLAAVFKRAGYNTMRTCKQGNSYKTANCQFTVRHDATKRGLTDKSKSAWHADQVLNCLNDRQARGDKDPWLICFGFSHPHNTRDGEPELLQHYNALN